MTMREQQRAIDGEMGVINILVIFFHFISSSSCCLYVRHY